MMDDDLIFIASPALHVAIHPLGAELWSLSDAQGRALMTDADPAFWTGRAPILFPFVGRLRGDVYRVDGREYSLPQHGFARRREFTLTEHGPGSATFTLESDDASRESYPFDFRLDMGFVVAGSTLAMTATITNTGSGDMPFSFGYHPAFAWPLPFGAAVEDHRITFEQEEPAPVRKVGGEPGLIALEPVPSPVVGRELAPTHEMFRGDALIWDTLNSRSLTWGAPGTPQLKIDFPDTPWLGIWQVPGAHYLCVEPWAGMADPVGFDGEVWDKPGVIRLGAGECRAFRMDVTLVPA